MKQVSKQLMSVYVALLAIALILVVLYESGVLESGALADSKQTEFAAMSIMELTTLAGAFLGLRLFKFSKIHNDLVTRQAPALLKWGLLRLLILEGPMICSTYLYYIYMNTTFGYLAIILLLCLPFVFPSLDRCIAETTDEKENQREA